VIRTPYTAEHVTSYEWLRYANKEEAAALAEAIATKLDEGAFDDPTVRT
jgi:hypothetical protein